MEEPSVRRLDPQTEAIHDPDDSIVASRVRHAIRPMAVVAIPVRNEQERIVGCLDSLSRQVGCSTGTFGILVFLNNCTDATSSVVAETVPRLTCPVRVVERTFVDASAGWARRQAMDLSAAWLAEGGGDGIILTTDADTRVGERWIAMNLASLAAGVDAVAGCFVLDAAEAARLPEALHRRGRLEARYEGLLTQLDAVLDPKPHNPWPCHWSSSGATLAVRRSVYDSVGGMPALPLGEDRAFVELLKTKDLKVRHDPAIVVVTSGRLDGRAIGGTADTMKLRCEKPTSRCDERLERIDRAVLRFFWRGTLRRSRETGVFRHAGSWSLLLGVPRNRLCALLERGTVGEALAATEVVSPRLIYRALLPSSLPYQILGARVVLALLRLRTSSWRTAARP